MKIDEEIDKEKQQQLSEMREIIRRIVYIFFAIATITFLGGVIGLFIANTRNIFISIILILWGVGYFCTGVTILLEYKVKLFKKRGDKHER